MQDNERASIRRVWTIFKEKISTPERFIKVNPPPRWMLNDYLDTNAIIAAPGGGLLTNRLILNTFLYGAYAHFNREHRQRLEAWKADSHQFPHMKLWFLVALQRY